MGNTTQSNICYSKQIPGSIQIKGQTKPRRNPLFLDALVQGPKPHIKTMRDAILDSFKIHSELKCYGTIVIDEKGERKVVSNTFKQIQQISQNLAKGIFALNLINTIEEVPGMKLKLLGIFSKNRKQWMITDIASNLYGLSTIPLYDTLGKENIIHILKETHMETCCCSKQCLEILLKLPDLIKIKNIICYDNIPNELQQIVNQKKIKIYLFSDVILKGQSSNLKYDLPPVKQNDVLTFCYTSGTTGPPKGALLSQKNFAATVASAQASKQYQIYSTDIYLSYLPLAHVMERVIISAMLYAGAHVIFYAGDILKLKDDMQLAKPTFFTSVPRLYSRFYELVNKNFDQAQNLKKCLISKAVQTKLQNLRETGEYTHAFYDSIVFSNTKAIFGGQVRIMISGSAPLLPNIQNFMKIISCVPVIQGYGQTQSMGANIGTLGKDRQSGHIGGPLPSLQFKLQDIPQMHYFSTDKDSNGNNKPRGQLCLRGPQIFLGYYKNQQKTKQAIDKNGWLHTGDIAQLQLNGSLKIIDRKKNIFKLQQGQYVAPEKTEGFCIKYGSISQLFVYGASTETFAIAIIVPIQDKLIALARQNNINGTFEQLCKNKQIRKIFLKKLNEFTKKQGLQSFEQPKNCYFQTTPFVEKKILTNTLKLQRFEAKKLYENIIKQLYDQGMI